MLSFVIPAYNEEALLPGCLASIREAMREGDLPYEIVVVDDSSSDATPAIAIAQGARLVQVAHRQISATRNSGALAACGDILFFVDADTIVSSVIIAQALAAIKKGAVGGGCIPALDGQLPLWWKVLYPMFELIGRVFGQPGGSCLFCTRQGYFAAGGFSTALYAAEDAAFASALKHHGKFVVLSARSLTSGRKVRGHSFGYIARLFFKVMFSGPRSLKDRRLLDLWYKPVREEAQPSPGR